MGMKLFSSSTLDNSSGSYLPGINVPDPSKYTIKFHRQIGKSLVCFINYPDCKNYEGNKILVFNDCALDDLLSQGKIDPHFSNNPIWKSPFARFEPTRNGWDMAVMLAELISKNKTISYWNQTQGDML
jgi:hypothetical protein